MCGFARDLLIWCVVHRNCEGSVVVIGCMKRLLLVAVVALVAVSCDSGSSGAVDSAVDAASTTSSTEGATVTSLSGSSADEPGIWVGAWSTPATALGSNELIPRLFVLGDEVLIVHEQNRGTTVEGAIYDPATGEATRIASSGLAWRANAAMAWTGQELLIVGGSNGPGIDQIAAAYSPVTDSWRPLPDPPGAVDAWENAITGPALWTGSEMLIYAEGLAFDPVTDEWRSIASPPGPPRTTETAVWTGDQLVVWGGCDASEPQCDDFASGILTDGFSYDPTSDEWRPIAASPLAAGVHPQGVWTGQDVLIYAGEVSEDEGATAAAYDPSSDSWRTMPNPPLSPRRYATSAWTGNYFVLWGGSGGGVEYDDGAAYDPETNTWLEMPQTPGFDERDRHAMVWVRDQLFITGGFETSGPLAFTPETSD
jgi:hypothetical protein